MSSWTISTKQDYVNLLTSSLYQASTYILIIAGIIIAITGKDNSILYSYCLHNSIDNSKGVIGILSAWFESKNFLIVVFNIFNISQLNSIKFLKIQFIILLMTIFLIEITAAILAFAYRAKVRLKIK